MNQHRRRIESVAFLLLLCAMFISRSLSAGDDWLPIASEDLALRDNPASPGAHAMILYREDRINTPNGTDDEYVRIKIFTKEGVNLASIFLGGESKR
jgi:hypothetical protein